MENVQESKKLKIFKLKGKKKFLVIAIVIVVAIFFIGKALIGGTSSNKTMITLDTVENRDVEELVSLKSVVEGETKFEVSSALNFKVTKILVTEGDVVKKGQVLAELDSTSVNDEIASANKRLELSKLNLEETIKNTQKQYDDAVMALEESRRKLEQSKELFAADAISQEELKQAELAVERNQTAISAFNVINGKVMANDAQKKAIDVEAQSVAILKKKLNDTYIKSNAEGTVTRVNIKVGSLATDTQDRKPMFVIEDLENLKMTVKVSEYDINKISKDQSVRIYAEVLGDDFVTGVVVKTLPTGEQKDQSSSERVIPVEIKINNIDKKLITGINARADIIIRATTNVPSVMFDSIVNDPNTNENKVYTVNAENKIEAKTVKTGISSDLYTEITSKNLKAGDKVIASPGSELKEGMEVKIDENSEVKTEDTNRQAQGN